MTSDASITMSSEGEPSSSTAKWWQKPFGMYQTNLREIDADIDVDTTATHILGLGATAWLIGVGGIQAQYPTKLAFHFKNPYLAHRPGHDLVGDAVKVAHSRGLRLLARMDFSKIERQLADQHPDWCYRDPEGQLQTHTAGLVSVCPNGPWYQEMMFEIVREVCTTYPMDGFFFNWMSMNETDYSKVYHGVCHCHNCQVGWGESSPGLDLPCGPSDPTYPQWLRWSRRVIDTLVARVRGLVAELRPEAGVILGATADIMFHEANNEIHREFWPHATAESISSWKSYHRPNVPVLCNSTVFFDMPYRMASESPELFAQYLLQAISRGANPSTYTMGVPGKIPYTAFPASALITQFHKTHGAIYDGMTPAAQTGLVRPDKAQMTASRHQEAVKEFRGLYQCLQQSTIPFDVVDQQFLTPMMRNGGLERYRRMVLPHLGHLAASDATTLDSWAKGGGALIATGEVGSNEDGDNQLECLPATKHRSTISGLRPLFSTYISPPQPNAAQNLYAGPTIPLYGAYHQFEWKSDSTSFYQMLGQSGFAPPEKAYGHMPTDDPGSVSAPYGKGLGQMIPFTIGRAYYDIGLPTLKDFFLDSMEDFAMSKEPIRVTAPEQVEVTLHRNGDDLVVHLNNMSGARRSNFGPHIPINDCYVMVKGTGKDITARAIRGEAELEIRDGRMQLPPLDLFEVVVIRGLVLDLSQGSNT